MNAKGKEKWGKATNSLMQKMIKPGIKISLGAYKLDLGIEWELHKLNDLISLHF